MPTMPLHEWVDTLSDEDARTECKRMHRYVQKCLGYPPWPIAVGERLPSSDDNVLVYMQDPDPNNEDGDESFWACGWLDEDGWSVPTYGILLDSGWKVTHWLPHPPKP